jgi:hypothetical protein
MLNKIFSSTLIAVILAVGLFVGCDVMPQPSDPHADVPASDRTIQYYQAELMESKYFLDSRTDLCFLIGSRGHALWISEVPCNAKVQAAAVLRPPSKTPIEINGKKYLEIE